MKLCFGTFATILTVCSANKVTKLDLCTALVRSVDGTCELTSNAVTKLLQCKNNLPNSRSNGLGDVISKARNADRSSVAIYFDKRIVPLIDPNKHELVMLALKEIIEMDDTIKDDAIIETATGLTKKALKVQRTFNFAQFLASVFLYTTQVDNKTGKETAEIIDKDFINSSAHLTSRVTFCEANNEHTLSDLNGFITPYFANIKEHFGSLRTLLYKDYPRNFYDFYVVNNIEHNRLNFQNITAHDLRNISNRIIIQGVGGLGKSMMMRHLLLNSIAEYKNFCHIPIFIPIKDYRNDLSLVDFVFAQVELYNKNFIEEVFVELLENGRNMLLFDGLDEITGDTALRFQRELEAFTIKYPNNMYVLSSRPLRSLASFSKFTAIEISPFTHGQAISLVDKLDYRPDEPRIKEIFRGLLEKSLYSTHKPFVENPLLLTILLMTFENFAHIPTKMHLFYEKAFITMSEAHDATKVGYKRYFKTGLMPKTIGKYFAEFCFLSYCKSKSEFTASEFESFFNDMKTKKTDTVADAFATDLCENLCLMYHEGSRYHFIHRSFQEYFSALFLSQQSDKMLMRVANFFEKRRSESEQVLKMLYDMVPEKVEASIFVPFLEELVAGGYWGFLKKIYPTIKYAKGDTPEYPINAPESYLYNFILNIVPIDNMLVESDLPENEDFQADEFIKISCGDDEFELTSVEDVQDWCQGEMPVVGTLYSFEVSEVKNGRYYDELREMLEDDEFIFKAEYNAMIGYIKQINSKQQEYFDFYDRII